MVLNLNRIVVHLAFLLWLVSFPRMVNAQEASILAGDELKKVLPTSFYFEGQSGPTQGRNAAAARFGEKRNVIIAMVDTVGYSSDVRGKYEGFLITDSKITLGGKELGVGVYGFGVTKEGQLNIFDIAGNPVLSVSAPKDSELKAPRPLTLVKGPDGLRMYRGRNYVVIAPK